MNGCELAVAVALLACAARQDEVTVADSPPLVGSNDRNEGHRSPLAPEPLLKLPTTTIRARGWLRQQLDDQLRGMVGRLPELSHWCRPDGSAWQSPDGSGENGWEELPYWLKGYVSLVHQVGGPKDVALATEWIEAILASQREDGWFGPESNRGTPDLWPNMPILWALRTHYEATGDERVLACLTKYFRWQYELPLERLLPESWQKVRGGDNLDVVHWLYDWTGERWLLGLAARLHERTVDWTGGIANWHGVNFCQGFREPAQFFIQSGEQRHLDATLRNYAEMMKTFGQVPGGMFGADENCRPGFGDPRQAAEACSMVEFMLSFEMLTRITGDTVWADRCEEVAFNSLPAAFDPWGKSLHYLTAPNLAQCDAADKSPGIQNGGCMLAFSADERYRCCQHNVAQGWPYFAENLWMKTIDGGFAAVMYAPCTLTGRVGHLAENVVINVETNYPFEEVVRVSVGLERPETFPLWFRVPGWCEGFGLSVAGKPLTVAASPGKWVRLKRFWTDGDQVELRLPMRIAIRRFPGNGDSVAVDRGPLTYSLKIDEEWRRIGGSDDFPDWEVLPRSPWNYGLVLEGENPARSIELVAVDPAAAPADPLHPFTTSPPVTLRAKARRIPAWQLDHHGLVAPLQPSPVKSDAPVEEVTLIPMGGARLRITAFPVIATGPDADAAHEWTLPPIPPKASHVHDSPFALNDGRLPASSIDLKVPRFTWWDHLGTVEWVQYDFAEPQRIGRTAAYWFDDTGIGRCRVPHSWRLLWLDGDTWRAVVNPSAYGVAPDTMNAVTFDPVTTRSVRLEATLQPEVSGGLFEWTVGE